MTDCCELSVQSKDEGSEFRSFQMPKAVLKTVKVSRKQTRQFPNTKVFKEQGKVRG